jgi:hypothetical protein
LREALKRELSQEKRLSTQARTPGARFLGYDTVPLEADEKHAQRRHRGSTGAPGVKGPREGLRANCARYLRYGKPRQLAARLLERAYTVVTPSQAEDRGVVPYYPVGF